MIYVPFLIEQDPEIHVYLSKLKKNMNNLTPLARSFHVDYAKYLDEEDDLLIILKVNIFFTSPLMVSLMLIVFGVLYVLTSSVAFLYLIAGFGLLYTIFLPPLWIFVFNSGLKKAGCLKKARFINWGKLAEKVYNGSIRRL